MASAETSTTTTATESFCKSSSRVNSTTEEITAIKLTHPGRCRIVSNADHSHSVTIQPENMDATIKFHIPESYPAVTPTISIRSSSLSEDNQLDLTQLLKTESQEMVNTFMISELVSIAKQWLHGSGMRAGKVTRQTDDIIETPSHKPGKNRKKKKKKQVKDDDIEEKKPSMKTAEDVIKRILWDDHLQRDDFMVGYLDRFRGIVEKYFSAFSWEDIATVDNNVLAIPKHRIQYFKYKDVTIWDKGERLDNVFGSTGSKITITDVIAKYDTDMHEKEMERGHQDSARDIESDSDEDDDEEDSDSDDGITVTVGSNAMRPETHDFDDDEEDEEGDLMHVEYNPYWKDKLRPNYFLAMRIQDEQIVKAIEEVQDFILDHEPLYNACIVPPRALHVTLCTVGLDTPEQVANAVSTLQDMKAELANLLPQEPLTFQGVSHFYHRVIYSKIDVPKQFMDFVEHLKMCLRQAGVDIRDGFEFVPHMTLMKTTRTVSRQKGSKYVDPWLYQGYTDMYFGTQKVQSIDLCSMSADRDEDGFYMTADHLDFNDLAY
ncbi:uncharacterized protein LOC121369484 [Gigantopelta aegis]|uniref:uncharacterized protein LOC121369484 n=1 Tax=Gigantopelta aegis TaxID=1735272 RepID=UPI001B88E21E|nr:uncharacterized protein LOC121369484 [Gigantopelta aegis]